MSGQYPYGQSLAAEGLPVSPRRRHPLSQVPSLLTTTLGNAHTSNHGLNAGIQTPVSTTSLSSPFSYPASPGGAMRGTSPMALRTPAGFNSAYNPREWGPSNGGSSSNSRATAAGSRTSSHTSRLAPRPIGPDEPVASPPPPYSPRRMENDGTTQRTSTLVISPADTTSPDSNPSRYSTPVSAATTISPEFAPSSYGQSPVPPSQPFSRPSPAVGREPTMPPPPPHVNTSSRALSSSRVHTDRLLSSLSSRNRATSNASPVTAISALQQNTAHAISSLSNASQANAMARPPSARRAASTGVIDAHGSSSRSISRSPSQSSWEPGMPLPPPPPGPPPPPSARSQSLNRPPGSESSDSDRTTSLAPRPQRVPILRSTLGPVPPTPADWTEEDHTSIHGAWPTRSNGPSQLHIDTGTYALRRGASASGEPLSAFHSTPAEFQPSHARRDSSLARSPAIRNRSAKGIRERRSDSRNSKARVTAPADEEILNTTGELIASPENIKPTDLILPNSGTVSRRRFSVRTPMSGRSIRSLDGALNEIDASLPSPSHPTTGDQESSQNTPQPASVGPPQQTGRYSSASISEVGSIPLPGSSPLPSDQLAISSASRRKNNSRDQVLSIFPRNSDERPISHLLHIPNADDSVQAPLVPLSSPEQAVRVDLLGPESPTAFSQRAIDRHHRFAEREAAADDDSERLDPFIQFILAESRIRRERYAAVFEGEDIDVAGMTHGLFALHKSENVEAPKHSVQIPRTKDSESIHASTASESSLQGSLWQVESNVGSRKHESPITASSDSSPHMRPEANWWKDYIPSLSPIASMSIITGQDEMDSRGRAPSRRFEGPGAGSAQGDAFNVFGKSNRESKYMGVPKEARSSPALFETGVPNAKNSLGLQKYHSGHPATDGSDEYPPEKVGWQEEAPFLPDLPPTMQSMLYTPDPSKLDISRLVTLPPPYPRHHPAVNNSHPDLSDERAIVRSLQDFGEPVSIRQSFQRKIDEKRHRAKAWCRHQQSLHEQDMQFKIERCEISPGGFDHAESEFEGKLARSEKDVTQADFDLFQSMVLTPLHAMFSERICTATSSLDRLSDRLFTDAQQHSPNLPQEEGDDHAELLEKLTLLKWLFEARENLHRETYTILSERNEKYKAIVMLPYRQSKNEEKLAEAEIFFAKDAYDRKLAFEQAVASRSEAFLAVVENNVTRGVEIQLSAFWDIAPSLLQLLQKIPHRLSDCAIQIPADEFTENPLYHEHPLQYLYSLLIHAERSSYQFIESQTNLLCLLHEIRSLALAARYRANESGDSEKDWADRTAIVREREERALMDDLKEKVAVVEGQWVEGLGSRIGAEKQRIKEFLEDTGGWDDEADLA